jgi:hypothetical protein
MRQLHSCSILAALLCLLSQPVIAQQFWQDLYTIRFRDTAGIVDPPDPGSLGNSAPDQTPAAIGAELGLVGEVVTVLHSLNAITARLDYVEVSRWKMDARVQSIYQETFLETNGAAFGEVANPDILTHPLYERGRLYVPRVDTAAQPGKFGAGIFEFDPASGNWKLLSVSERKPPADPGPLPGFDVQATVTDSFPVQVILQIRDIYIASCVFSGDVSQRLNGQTIEVLVHPGTLPPTGGVCTDPLSFFDIDVPLKVYGLPAGTYEYTVNGKLLGSFVLGMDNAL